MQKVFIDNCRFCGVFLAGCEPMLLTRAPLWRNGCDCRGPV